ncbi:intraflagellar transport protein 52-like [Pelomyxa schiedti]|nr:intraflagellar transport protein 52-like [Pelomyxa schiedti]
MTVLFDTYKKESKHPLSTAGGFDRFASKLRASGKYKPLTNKEPFTLAKLQPHAIVVLGCPREPFTEHDIHVLNEYLDGGGSILLCLSESGKCSANINNWIQEYGIKAKPDAVVRTSFLKYHHPKEVLISTGGVINREINIIAGKRPNAAVTLVALQSLSKPRDTSMPVDSASAGPKPKSLLPFYAKHSEILSDTLTFVYPYGCTLEVERPSVPVLSTSAVAYPAEKPIATFYTTPVREGFQREGHLVVIGSAHIFDRQWLDREENEKLLDVFLKWLTPGQHFPLNSIDANVRLTSTVTHVPDIESLAEKLRPCLQDIEEAPKNLHSLFDDSLFSFNTSLIPEAVALYEKLGVAHQPLSLIVPRFEAPLPPLQPAVFPPIVCEPEPPLLELYDLDTQFASEKVRLAHQTNSCTEEHLEYYIQTCGEILGVSQFLPDEHKSSPKHILAYVFKNVVNWKKINFTSGCT